jgi:hypothetical protein
VVNRREDDANSSDEQPNLQGNGKLSVGRRRRRDTVESNELEIHIIVSYKTLALVFLIFNVLGGIINHLSGNSLSQFSEKLLGLLPF